MIGRTSSMLDEIESKSVHKDIEGNQWGGKEVRQ